MRRCRRWWKWGDGDDMWENGNICKIATLIMRHRSTAFQPITTTLSHASGWIKTLLAQGIIIYLTQHTFLIDYLSDNRSIFLFLLIFTQWSDMYRNLHISQLYVQLYIIMFESKINENISTWIIKQKQMNKRKIVPA